MTTATRFPGWRTMTAAQRHNARQDEIFTKCRALATPAPEPSPSRPYPPPGPFADRFPELASAAEAIAADTCRAINARAATIDSPMPYKAQAILEHLITILEKRV